jgi:DNA repair protein RadA/Sms
VLVYLEVLLNKANGKYPQRIVSGIEQKRVQLIVAILERYLRISLSDFDIYVNIPGEFDFRDTGLDLAIAAALYSQSKGVTIDKQLIFI